MFHARPHCPWKAHVSQWVQPEAKPATGFQTKWFASLGRVKFNEPALGLGPDRPCDPFRPMCILEQLSISFDVVGPDPNFICDPRSLVLLCTIIAVLFATKMTSPVLLCTIPARFFLQGKCSLTDLTSPVLFCTIPVFFQDHQWICSPHMGLVDCWYYLICLLFN